MITTTFGGVSLQFKTAPTLFSPHAPDEGTLAMLANVEIAPNSKVLDLGCGWGFVGIALHKTVPNCAVWMVDNNPDAVQCAQTNAFLNGCNGINILQSNAFSDLDTAGFDYILSNPPYHADFSVAKTFIEKGFNRLKIGGIMAMVTKRKTWYENKFASIFGGVQIKFTNGYYVFTAQRRTSAWAKRP